MNLVKKHFKKGGKIDQTGFNLSKILNTHTVKLSYSTTNNIARHIVKHNNTAENTTALEHSNRKNTAV